jgi:hypothetical protein
MGAKTIDQAKKAKIVRYLKNHSQNETAAHFKISTSTVNGIANKNPTIKNKIERSGAKNKTAAATLTHKIYAKADRVQVLHKLMGAIDLALNSPAELRPGNLRDLSIALGTTLDKYRLEESEDEEGRSGIDDLMDEIKKEAEIYEKSRTSPS